MCFSCINGLLPGSEMEATTNYQCAFKDVHKSLTLFRKKIPVTFGNRDFLLLFLFGMVLVIHAAHAWSTAHSRC